VQLSHREITYRQSVCSPLLLSIMLYQIQKSDLEKASSVLSKSFIDYPIFVSILPNEEYRRKKLQYLFHFLVTLGLLNGEVWAPSNDLEGVSIWIDSSSTKASVGRILMHGFLPLLFHLNIRSICRFIKVGIRKQKERKKILNGPYYLLDVIGVDPQWQGKGFARFMIESKLNEYDKHQYPCYLETSKRENIAFYQKYGFRLLHEYDLMTARVYCLIKESKKSAALT
jgi:GNAT superfamily N-acetyltransferase